MFKKIQDFLGCGSRSSGPLKPRCRRLTGQREAEVGRPRPNTSISSKMTRRPARLTPRFARRYSARRIAPIAAVLKYQPCTSGLIKSGSTSCRGVRPSSDFRARRFPPAEHRENFEATPTGEMARRTDVRVRAVLPPAPTVSGGWQPRECPDHNGDGGAGRSRRRRLPEVRGMARFPNRRRRDAIASPAVGMPP